MNREINHALCRFKRRIKILARIVRCGDDGFGICNGGIGDSQPHTAGLSCNKNGKHTRRCWGRSAEMEMAIFWKNSVRNTRTAKAPDSGYPPTLRTRSYFDDMSVFPRPLFRIILTD